MTNERKICESTIEPFKIAGGWEGGFKTVWQPIEPQPCCENCRFYDEYPNMPGEGSCSEILKWVEPMGYTDHMDVDKNFCCNGWEAKK